MFTEHIFSRGTQSNFRTEAAKPIHIWYIHAYTTYMCKCMVLSESVSSDSYGRLFVIVVVERFFFHHHRQPFQPASSFHMYYYVFVFLSIRLRSFSFPFAEMCAHVQIQQTHSAHSRHRGPGGVENERYILHFQDCNH